MTVIDITAVKREIHIEARPETVYALLTDSDRMVSWMGRAVTFDPRPGGKVRIDMNGFDIMRGSVVEAVPYSRLVYTMGWESLDDDTVRPGTSTVEFTLEPAANGTLVKLVHTGLPELARQPHGEGWDFFLARLGAVANDQSVDHEPALTRAEELASRLNTLLIEAAEVIEGYPADRWDAATAGEGWSVAAVAGHIVTHISLAHVAADIANGRETPVASLTLDMLTAGNAEAAASFQDPGQSATVAAIRADGRKAVAAVRALSDEELARTANMAFAGGQPVPAAAMLEGPLLTDLRSHLDSIIAASSVRS